MNQKLIFTNRVGEALDAILSESGNPQVYVVADVNTAQCVLPLLTVQSRVMASAHMIVIKAGDVNKTLDNVQNVWKALHEAGANRGSVVINVGGGVVTDLGGFAAATFKRGLRVINVPTTLLGAVDASVGGKTGINFNGYKNEIGTFTEPDASVISSCFFFTLPQQELLSGYAEMLKHALLENRAGLARLLDYNVVCHVFNADTLLQLIETSVQVKAKIVGLDFRESGIRKALNLGHTAGHAFESLAMRRQSPLPHGFAVAQGIVVSLVLSHLRLGFPSDVLHTFAAYVRRNYSEFPFTCDDYPELLRYMAADKKNTDARKVAFTLLADVGDVRVDQQIGSDEIKTALDIYRDLMGI